MDVPLCRAIVRSWYFANYTHQKKAKSPTLCYRCPFPAWVVSRSYTSHLVQYYPFTKKKGTQFATSFFQLENERGDLPAKINE